MAEKYFNRDEAEKLLPLIGDWLTQAREERKKLTEVEEELVRAVAKIMALGGSQPPHAALVQKKAERDRLAERLAEVVSKIQETGCLVKDLGMGLVDFPSLRGDEEVYLCWKLGEERIDYWHGIDEGYAGRRRLDPDEALPDDRSAGSGRVQ